MFQDTYSLDENNLADGDYPLTCSCHLSSPEQGWTAAWSQEHYPPIDAKPLEDTAAASSKFAINIFR
jgi:hypothetical protein